MSILAILNELASTASTLQKEAIIRREANNADLKAVFTATYNPMITYGIKKIPVYKKHDGTQTLANGIKRLNLLADRSFTGNAGIDYLTSILTAMTEDDAIVIERIIDRDLKCGTSDTLAARVWPGFVPTFDVMLSHKDISGIKFPAYAQVKSDGARCHMTRIGNKAFAFSRSGKPIELQSTFDEAICMLVNDGETLDGELLYVSPQGKIVDRATGNGIVNKAVKNTITVEQAQGLVFATWDIVDFTSTIPYTKRIERLTKVSIANPNNKIAVLSTIIVNNKEEAEAFFAKCLSKGEEGAMVKNMNHVWQPKRTKDLGKMKAEEVADLKIVGMEEGTGKNEGSLGALICETDDGKLRVKVGIFKGHDEEIRQELWDNQVALQGRIVEVLYNAVIKDKNKDQHSLFLPRFLKIREDKFVANTLDELK